jgi:hypothetical protein
MMNEGGTVGGKLIGRKTEVLGGKELVSLGSLLIKHDLS